jgi:NADPH:quinone reductase
LRLTSAQVQVQQRAIGLNYIDVYFRSGLYPQTMPAGMGMEAAGVVTAVGAGTQYVKVGDRVAYAGNPTGAYADVRNMPENNLVKLPKGIDFDTGAAMMLKGMTVQYLFRCDAMG